MALQWGEIKEALFHQHFFASWQGTHSYIGRDQTGEIHCCNFFLCQGLAVTGPWYQRNDAIAGPFCHRSSLFLSVKSHWCHKSYKSHNTLMSQFLCVNGPCCQIIDDLAVKGPCFFFRILISLLSEVLSATAQSCHSICFQNHRSLMTYALADFIP